MNHGDSEDTEKNKLCVLCGSVVKKMNHGNAEDTVKNKLCGLCGSVVKK
jgi:ribosomal protein S27AE